MPPKHKNERPPNKNIFADGEDDPLSDKQSSYPEWSWDQVRTWVAIRRDNDYTDDQIRALADEDVVMLEKFNGHKTHGTTEKGTLHAAKRIKAVNSKVKILFYLNAMVHYEGYRANKDWQDEWAMFDPKKNETFKWRDTLPCYDHTNLDFREWWIQRALEMVAHDEIDGIFIDAIVKADRRFLPTKNASEAYIETAEELRSRLPEGKILIGNALRANAGTKKDGNLRHLKYLDGSYLEGWAKQDRLAQTLDLMSKALDQGRIIMLNAGPEGLDEDDLDKLKTMEERYEYVGRPQYIGFSLGFFLLIVDTYAYFSYRVGVDAKKGALFDNDRWEAVTRKLGKPLGKYVKESKNTFTREFEYVSVRVNIDTMDGTLTVKEDEKGDEL